MTSKIIIGILIPFLGTTLGSAFVFFMKRDFHFMIRRALTGFASGVMTSAAVWSLILPALDFADNIYTCLSRFYDWYSFSAINW